MSDPRASVIIRTKNEAQRLSDVLNSLKSQDYDGGVEIIVVDSGSTDGTVEIAREHGARVIEMTPETFSFGRALNVGARASRGEFLVNISGHAVPVHNTYLQTLLAPYSDPNVVATFGRDLPFPDACPSQARDVETWFPSEQVEFGQYFSNANSSVRRSAWEEQPWDETLPGAEDAHWAQQMLSRGYRIVYVPKALVYHSHSNSPLFVYRRAVRETRGFKAFDQSRAGYDLAGALRFWLGMSWLDIRYTLETRRNPLWIFHILAYRGAQALGLYWGAR
jgi:rhamnosyltransferase